MMGWQWHQLDHMQITCTVLQTDNHASTSSLNFSHRLSRYYSNNCIMAQCYPVSYLSTAAQTQAHQSWREARKNLECYET